MSNKLDDMPPIVGRIGNDKVYSLLSEDVNAVTKRSESINKIPDGYLTLTKKEDANSTEKKKSPAF